MEVPFSIEMVIWVAVGGRATLIGAIIGTLLVQLARTFLSGNFPEVWLFFQGALFLIVVTVLPDGIVGWVKNQGWKDVFAWFGYRPRVQTYPSLEQDLEVIKEKQDILGE